MKPLIWGHARGRGLLTALDFTGYAPGALVLPADLAFARASGSATARSGPATIVSGIGVDTARISDPGGLGNLGLLIEESRINVLLNARNFATGAGNTNWFFNSAGGAVLTPDAIAGPDGSLLADRVQCPTAVFGVGENAGSTGATSWAVSLWQRNVTGTGFTGFNVFRTTSGRVGVSTQIGTSWTRLSVVVAALLAEGVVTVPVDGRDWSGLAVPGAPAGARDVYVDFAQREPGGFPTSSIVTAGASVTRAGERLWHTAPSKLLDGGRLSWWLRHIPLGAPSAYTGTPPAWNIDANNRCTFNPATGTFTVTIGGSAYTTASGATWSPYDVLDIWIEAGGGSLNTVVKYRVNSGAATTLGTSGAPQAAIVTPSTIDLCCVSTTSQFSGALQFLQAYRAGTRPAWAA